MRAMDVTCVCLLALVLPVYLSPLPNEKGGMKEKFKEFLRKAVYGITPTTIYTTLRPWRFPEEYDPIRVLDWQLREEKRKGITTPDFEPALTEVTNLWDGFWNDPTIDDVTLWCMRHLHANDSQPTTVKRYWESDFGNGESNEAIAKYWKQEALKENSEWWATYKTTKFVRMEDLTADSEGSWRCSPNWGESHVDSADRRIVAEVERIKEEEYQKNYAKYNYNYSPRSNQETEAPGKHERATEAPTHQPTEAPKPGETARPVKRPPSPIIPGIPNLEPDTESEYVSMDAIKRKPKW